MDFETWLDELISQDTRATAAKKADYAQSTLSRQLQRGYLRPEMVIALCRAYGRSPVTGLIETGYLYEYETEGVAIPYALETATNKQILDEILRRSDPEARHLFGVKDSYVDNVVDIPYTNDNFIPEDEFPFDEAVADDHDEDALRYGNDDDINLP